MEEAQYNGCVSTYLGASTGTFTFDNQECVPVLDQDGNYGSSLFSLNKDEVLVSGTFATDAYRQVGGIRSHKYTAVKDTLYGTNHHSWLGHSIVKLDESGQTLAFSAHGTGEVKIVDSHSYEQVKLIANPDGNPDQFGYSIIVSNLTINQVIKPCLIIGAPVSTYGIHTNGGAIFIFDATTYELLAKLHSDKALGRFGRSFGQTETRLLIGAPRYHEKANALQEEGAVFVLSKSTSLPLGDVTEICQDGQKAPCLENWIESTLVPPMGEKRSHFGHKIQPVFRGPNEFISVSAPKSSRFAQQGGIVYIYKSI